MVPQGLECAHRQQLSAQTWGISTSHIWPGDKLTDNSCIQDGYLRGNTEESQMCSTPSLKHTRQLCTSTFPSWCHIKGVHTHPDAGVTTDFEVSLQFGQLDHQIQKFLKTFHFMQLLWDIQDEHISLKKITILVFFNTNKFTAETATGNTDEEKGF